jgi:phosphoribosylamine---glycine ligase
MNILIVGAGAREHAIAAALYRSPQQPTIFCYGSALNPGIRQMTHHYAVGNITDIHAIASQAKDWQIDFAIIGPEAPLEKGLADQLWSLAIPVIGPRKALAQIETSKMFARDLMQRYQIPGLPQYRHFSEKAGIEKFLNELGEGNYVVKANGLMGGKGVKVAGDHLHSINEALAFCDEILAKGQPVLIEEKLIGQEFSFMCFCDGNQVVPMPIVQDHKRAFNDDKGPNTGGMGSYSDADHSLPFLSQSDVEAAFAINEKVLTALMTHCQEKYVGILYGSFIVTKKGVFVIEFNARFGDPEALNVLSILESDFVAICQSLITGHLNKQLVSFSPQATVCKYAVPEGYPDQPCQPAKIDISAVKNKAYLYLGAVDIKENQLIATGSRTAAYVGVAASILQAEEIAEREIRAIDGPLFHRSDIGTRQLIERRIDFMRGLRENLCSN